MNKFTEQNKATAKIEPTTTAAAPSKAASAAATDAAKKLAADQAKTTPQKPTDAVKKDAFNGKWQSQIQAAKSHWNKISESELIKSEGIETRLADLVQQRYSLTQDVARKQVKSFIDKCHC